MSRTIDLDLAADSVVSPCIRGFQERRELKVSDNIQIMITPKGETEKCDDEGKKELPNEEKVKKWKTEAIELYSRNIEKLEKFEVVEGYFISYKQNDGSNTLSERLYNKLPGNNWYDMMYTQERTVAAMIKGIMRRDKFICFLSPHYFDSNFCVTELTIALQGNRVIIPVYNQDTHTTAELLNIVPKCFSPLKGRDFIGLFRDIIPCTAQLAKIFTNRKSLLSLESEDEFYDSDDDKNEDEWKKGNTIRQITRSIVQLSNTSETAKQSHMVKKGEELIIKNEDEWKKGNTIGQITRSMVQLSNTSETAEQSHMLKKGEELIMYCSNVLRSIFWDERKTKNDSTQYTLETAPMFGVDSAHTGKLKPPMIKSVGVIEKPAEEVIKILSDIEAKGVYHKSFRSGEVVQHYDSDTSLRYEVYKGSILANARDFLVLHCKKQDPQDRNAVIIAQVSTSDSRKPPYKNVVRAKSLEAWSVSSLGENSCRVTNIVHVKVGGFVGMVNSSHLKSFHKNVEHLRTALLTGEKRNKR